MSPASELQTRFATGAPVLQQPRPAVIRSRPTMVRIHIDSCCHRTGHRGQVISCAHIETLGIIPEYLPGWKAPTFVGNIMPDAVCVCMPWAAMTSGYARCVGRIVGQPNKVIDRKSIKKYIKKIIMLYSYVKLRGAAVVCRVPLEPFVMHPLFQVNVYDVLRLQTWVRRDDARPQQ